MTKTGRLVSDGRAPLGAFMEYEWFRCVDCGAGFPREDYGSTKCNGIVINLCPWCRPDSEPWKNGRGR